MIEPPPEAEFIRGDADASGSIGLDDAIFILMYLFKFGESPLCEDAADADDEKGIGLLDAIYILVYRFKFGPVPPPPFPGCGIDESEDDLGCEFFPWCEPVAD